MLSQIKPQAGLTRPDQHRGPLASRSFSAGLVFIFRQPGWPVSRPASQPASQRTFPLLSGIWPRCLASRSFSTGLCLKIAQGKSDPPARPRRSAWDAREVRPCHATQQFSFLVGDVSVQSGQIFQSKGLVSIDRSEAAALLSTTPRLRTRSSTNDFAPLRCMGWVERSA